MMMFDVDWEVARDENFRSVVRRGTALAHPELGHSVHVTVRGLLPAREYWYRFRVGEATSAIGRTRTAPDSGSTVDRLRIGVCGCNHYEQGFFTAYRHMAEERFDAIFHTGDYIYEYRPWDGRSARVRTHLGDEAYTLDDYRRRYAQYKLDPDLQAAHASAPFVVTWDDHEIDNDWSGLEDESGTPPALFRLRRAAAFQAYYEAMPLRRSSFPTPLHLQLYRQSRFGRLMTVNALDTRQYRTANVCRADARPGCPEFRSPKRSMLGERQERWLDRQLDGSAACWNVLSQQVPLFGRDATQASFDNRHVMDKWSGYPAARERLVDSLAASGRNNVVVLSGDVHSHWAADVPRRISEPDGPSAAVEFTCTSISSGGDGSDVADYWPGMAAEHPHVCHHGNRRGYLACTVTPTLWQSDFMNVDQVTTSGGVLSRSARVQVEVGRPSGHVT